MGLDPIKIFSAANYSTLDLTHCFISRDHFLPMRMLKLHRRVNLRKNIFIVSGSGFEFSVFRVPILGCLGSLGVRNFSEHDEAEDRGRIPERLDRLPPLLLREANGILLDPGPDFQHLL